MKPAASTPIPGRSRPRRRRATRTGLLAAAVAAAAIVYAVMLHHPSVKAFTPTFPAGTHLITNELAYRHPHQPGVRTSPDWWVTSGSLYSHDHDGWTGIPDHVSPNAASSNGTDSAVFRLITRRADFDDTTVSFDLSIQKYLATPHSPAHNWDGVHIFLRYQSQYHLYAVSVDRRDGSLAIKKKLPGGSANGGTYTELAATSYHQPLDTWTPTSATITNPTDHTVRIDLTIDHHRALTAIDDGKGGPPILRAGRVGLRSDNCNFYFRKFTAGPPRQ